MNRAEALERKSEGLGQKDLMRSGAGKASRKLVHDLKNRLNLDYDLVARVQEGIEAHTLTLLWGRVEDLKDLEDFEGSTLKQCKGVRLTILSPNEVGVACTAMTYKGFEWRDLLADCRDNHQVPLRVKIRNPIAAWLERISGQNTANWPERITLKEAVERARELAQDSPELWKKR